MSEKLEALDTAKRNVAWLLEHANGLVDMHGLAPARLPACLARGASAG